MAVIDYTTPCGQQPESLIKRLSRTMVIYGGHVRLNSFVVSEHCNGLTDFWTCDQALVDPERALVENVFAYEDNCNPEHLGIKFFVNLGEE